jgi:hypothetical protein
MGGEGGIDPLSELGLLYGTDKVRDHWYTPEYEARFSHARNLPIALLEIGVGGYADAGVGGASLQMWRDYFTQGTIVGLDIEDKSQLDLGERVHIEQGDQSDARVLHRLGKTYGPFDIIIDDGSHRVDDIVQSWVVLWEYVKAGGWYVVEDLQTAYWPAYGGSSVRTGDTTIGWLYGLINHIHYTELDIPNYRVTHFDETLTGLDIRRNLAFLLKGDNTKPSEWMPQHPHAAILADERTDGVSIEVIEG